MRNSYRPLHIFSELLILQNLVVFVFVAVVNICDYNEVREHARTHAYVCIYVCMYVFIYRWPKKMYTLFTHQYLWNKLWQCLDADGGHFEHLH
jgi:hypothetical protein